MKDKRCVFCFILLLLFSKLASQVVFHSYDEAVQFALQNVKSYQYQKMSVLESMQMSEFSIQDFLPELGINYSESDSILIEAPDSRTKSFQLSLQQEIFDGGRKRYAYEMAQLDSIYLFNEYEQSMRSFSSSIIAMYASYLTQKEMLQIHKDLIDVAETQLQIIEKEAELGLTLETDYLEYVISVISLENENKQLERELERLLRTLKITVGMQAEVDLHIADELSFDSYFISLSEHFDVLWALVKNTSLELQKGQTSLLFAQKQDEYTDRWYLPTISLQGSVSFSGEQFPLTEPNYSVKMLVSFPNSKIFPINFSNGLGFNTGGLSSVSNDADVGLVRSTTSLFERRLGDISILQAMAEQESSENALYESLQDMVYTHADYIDTIEVSKQMIDLEETRLDIMALELETGAVKRIDYLNDLISLAETRMSLVESISATQELERSIEIMTGISFGELVDVITL